MLKTIMILILLGSAPVLADPWFDGLPEYTDDSARELAEAVLAAHGGMQPMQEAKSLQFRFFTKVVGAPTPFYSFEAVDLATGNAYVDWPLWDATIALNDGELWSHQWPMPMPAGFFVRLTTSFLTLPWQIQADGAHVGPVSRDYLPDDDKEYAVLRITFDARSASIPGTYYDLFVDPESKLMKGIRFDINHPAMVATPGQALGPNYHVFDEYRKFSGIVLPTFYLSYGSGIRAGGKSNAHHFVWDVSLDVPFANDRLAAPEGARRDTVSMDWWRSSKHSPQSSTSTLPIEILAGEK